MQEMYQKWKLVVQSKPIVTTNSVRRESTAQSHTVVDCTICVLNGQPANDLIVNPWISVLLYVVLKLLSPALLSCMLQQACHYGQ